MDMDETTKCMQQTLVRQQKLISLFNTWYLGCLRANLQIGPVNEKVVQLWSDVQEVQLLPGEISHIINHQASALTKIKIN